MGPMSSQIKRVPRSAGVGGSYEAGGLGSWLSGYGPWGYRQNGAMRPEEDTWVMHGVICFVVTMAIHGQFIGSHRKKGFDGLN